MIRHPAAAISVTHKDADDLAAAQRMLLSQIQKGEGKNGAGNDWSDNKTPQQALPSTYDSLLGNGGDTRIRDGFSAARKQRQAMSVSERLGL
ncbi:hypothetical protein GGH99_005362 [Coemansia sp. RSA 1285]|nr:hypothetical protein GGH99_005362 [Coemansia sp. RSA 1285]